MKHSARKWLFAVRCLSLAMVSSLLGGACAEQPREPTAPDQGGQVLTDVVAQATGTIQIVQGGTGQGTITSDPAGIDCTLGGPAGPTGTCEASFEGGTRVKLTAKAADGSRFEGWAPVNSCPKPKNLTVVAGGTHSCQPVFSFRESPTFLLQVALVGNGRVTSDPAGIDCSNPLVPESSRCAENFPNGSVVTLTATPAEGWAFVGWSGEDKQQDCVDGVVTMDAAKRCTATFVQ